MANLDIYAPFDSGPGANVTEDTWRLMMRHMLGSASGIIRAFENEFAVTANASGMQVFVDSGECWMRGHFGRKTTSTTLPIAAAHATLPRKDRVILRADFLNNVISLEVLTGTAAASPTEPTLTQNTTVWETALAVVDVTAADVTIAANQVTDDRRYTQGNARYLRVGNQLIPDVTATKVIWDLPSVTSPGNIRLLAGGTDFEFQHDGLYLVSFGVAWAISDIAASTRSAWISNSAGTVRFASAEASTAAARFPAASVSFTRRWLAGEKISAYVFDAGDSGSDNIQGHSGAQEGTYFDITWIGHS
jgi:hypothetical protein